MNRKNKTILSQKDLFRGFCVMAAVAFTWLLFAAELNLSEGIAGMLAGLAVATAGYELRRRTGHHQAGLRLWFIHGPLMLLNALQDCWILTKVLINVLRGRHSKGSFQRLPFEYGSARPLDVGRRVLMTFGTTLQPNSYVIGFNKRKGEVLIHQLELDSTITIAEDIRRAK